jgi:hypothetical protein
MYALVPKGVPRHEGGDLVVGPSAVALRVDDHALDRSDWIVLAPAVQDGNAHEQREKLAELVRRCRCCCLGGNDRVDVLRLHLLDEAMAVFGNEMIEDMPIGPLRLGREGRPLARDVIEGHKSGDGPCLGAAPNGLWSTF